MTGKLVSPVVRVLVRPIVRAARTGSALRRAPIPRGPGRTAVLQSYDREHFAWRGISKAKLDGRSRVRFPLTAGIERARGAGPGHEGVGRRRVPPRHPRRRLAPSVGSPREDPRRRARGVRAAARRPGGRPRGAEGGRGARAARRLRRLPHRPLHRLGRRPVRLRALRPRPRGRRRRRARRGGRDARRARRPRRHAVFAASAASASTA